MASSDDESDFVPKSVSNYHFVDDDDAPTSFSVLPLYLSESENVDDNVKEQIFVHGCADNGLQKIHKEVIAWKFDLSNAKPELSVLTKEKNWIKLEKPRKSFEEIIRTVLITLQCLHFVSRNPDASEKSVWDHLSKFFSFHDVKPSQNDLVDHIDMISKAHGYYKSLAKSKFLHAFVNKKPRKRKIPNEDVKPTTMSGFIVDDDDDMLEDCEDDDDQDDDIYDSVCAFCDNGGHIICCDGICLRSFHPTVEDGIDSKCESLGLSKREEEAINNFYCENCKYKQHQCFVCGELGSSDKSSGTEVFQCGNATCGHFYHPNCVAKLLYPDDEDAAEELQKNIASGRGFFTCPMHKCCVCRQGEDKQIKELQFAVCRRCPTSYHRKCLPKEIHIVKKVENDEEEAVEEDAEEEEEEEGVESRAWEGLLPGRLLLYCFKHEIDDELGTPDRDIRFPGRRKKERVPEFGGRSEKVLSDKKKLNSKDSFSKSMVKEKWESSEKKDTKWKRNENISSGFNSLRKVKEFDASRKASKGSMIADATEVISQDSESFLGNRLFSLMKSSEGKLGKQGMKSEPDDTMTPKEETKKLSTESPSLDADAERRILALMEDVESSITLEDVISKRRVPSTHSYTLKQVVEKTITAGRVDAAVQAIRTALEKLEGGCSPEDAKAICEPEVLRQIFKWKNKLSVYLAPFLRGMRYTSFGRHFTKVEKLEKIVDLLHCYVKDGDMIVDFCCGSNDFSFLMKKKLEETGKECSYKNYDLFQPKIDFNFEKRDWMNVNPNELPKRGSQLIMGLNPPFGVKAALANNFINHALKFKPKLLILIVPPETERLDKKTPPYDLIWEDNQCLAGKSFYLPGSVDENDKQMEQWNLTTPPLYLWSRRDWSARHMLIAQKHGHISIRKEGPSSEKFLGDGNTSKLPDQPLVSNKEQSQKETVTTVRENHYTSAAERKQSTGTSHKRKHGEYNLGGGENEKKAENVHDGKKGTSSKTGEMPLNPNSVENRKAGSDMSLDSDSHKGMPHRSSSKAVDGRSLHKGTASKSPKIVLHHDAVGNRLHNPDRRSPASLGSSGSGSYRGMAHRVREVRTPKTSEAQSNPYLDRVQNSRSHMQSGRPYGNTINYNDHEFSHSNIDYRYSGESAEFGYRSYPTEMGQNFNAPLLVSRYGQEPDYSGHRNFTGSSHEPAYGHMESYRMNMQPGMDSYRMNLNMGGMEPATESYYGNLSATQRYAPRLDELNHTRMNNNMMGPDPSMLNTTYTSGMYNPPPPHPGYDVDSIGFAQGPHDPNSRHNSTGWLDE